MMRRAFAFYFLLALAAACWLPLRARGQGCCVCACGGGDECVDGIADIPACVAQCITDGCAEEGFSLGDACVDGCNDLFPTPTITPTVTNTVPSATPTDTPTDAPATDTPTLTPTATPCSLVVTSTSDSGAGSLREAMGCANTQTGATVSFNIAGAGQHDLDVASDLARITANGTTIDCLTQGDSACDPDALQNAVLRIHLVPSAALHVGFAVDSPATGVTIRGCWWASALPVVGENIAFGANGTNTVITCNRVDGWHGPQYRTSGGAVNVLYDANIAAGGDSEGFLIGLAVSDLTAPPTGTLTRNFCGTVDGMTGAGVNGGAQEGCITVRPSNGIVVSNNVIIGNNSHGILVQDQFSQGAPTNFVITGNRVGVGITGLPLGNAFDGIGVTEGTGGTVNATNIVSANSGTGIHFGAGTSGNTATSNRVGTDTTGANDPDFCNIVDQITDEGTNTTTGNTVNTDCVPHPLGCCALDPGIIGFSCADSTTIGQACSQALCDALNLPPPDGGGPGTCLYLSPGNNGACMSDFDGTCPAPEPTATPTASGPTPTPCGDVGMATFRAVVADEAASTTSITLTLGGGDVATSDVCVAHIVTTANTGPPTPPSDDWQLILSATQPGIGREVVYLVTGIAPGAYAWTFDTSGDIYGAIACYINVDIANSPDFNFSQFNASGTTHTTGAVMSTFMDVLWVSLAAAPTATTWTAPVEFSSRSATSGAISGGVADAGLGSPGSYGPYTWTSSGATTSNITAMGLVPPCQPTPSETPTDTPKETPTNSPTATPGCCKYAGRNCTDPPCELPNATPCYGDCVCAGVGTPTRTPATPRPTPTGPTPTVKMRCVSPTQTPSITRTPSITPTITPTPIQCCVRTGPGCPPATIVSGGQCTRDSIGEAACKTPTIPACHFVRYRADVGCETGCGHPGGGGRHESHDGG